VTGRNPDALITVEEGIEPDCAPRAAQKEQQSMRYTLSLCPGTCGKSGCKG
jgi:hypothetical protein